ncbi:hypothetical protein MSAN_00523700 [Mycena sanguinolenta]|uniref:Uncharacterized protein n=1 Tax=Mycena sanguinolenta TaxID=230812 RepID=A0A8H6ZA57_9AGAR|nr:hypothetical protein MSAN_00523700 [Mycena sanguinolenta]
MSAAPTAQYDQSLLAQAPVLTRAQRQEGYDHVLLEPIRGAKRTESNSALKETPTDPEVQAEAAAETQNNVHTSWWRRRKLIVGAVITLVVIAAVVGGSVGGTLHKGSKSTSDTVGIGTLSAGVTSTGTLSASESGIFGTPSVASASQEQLNHAVVTRPVPSSNIFVPIETTRHLFTTRRR